jgi:predicted transcriptional regulator
MMRACFNLMIRAEERIAEELRKTGIQRPVNEQVAILEFEEELSEVLLAAFKQIPLRE